MHLAFIIIYRSITQLMRVRELTKTQQWTTG
jgi:hypothetical protein